MMIIRTCKLVAILLLQWLVLVGATHAAAPTGKKAVEKQTLVKKATKKPATRVMAKKITHPCARKSAQQLNKRAAPYQKSIDTHAKAYGIESELIKSVITIESCYRVKAVSPKGAQGLMQLIPDTAERFGISNPYDSHQNIKGGARYLSWLSKRFDGDLTKVLAGYNAGEGRVDRYNGIPPFRETRNYVHDVLVVYKKLKADKNPVTPKPAADKPILAGKQPSLDPSLTPRQRQHQLNQRRHQLARQKQIRQQQAQAKRQQQLRRQQQASLKTAPGTVVVIGKPAKPAYVMVPAKPQKQAAPQRKPVTRPVAPTKTKVAVSKPAKPLKATVAKPVHKVAQKPVMKPRVRPVFRKVRAVIPRQPVNHLQAQINQQGNQQNSRIKDVFTSPIKPGRGGWMANKSIAPQLYKQQ